MLKVIMLSAIMLDVFMQSVVVPAKSHFETCLEKNCRPFEELDIVLQNLARNYSVLQPSTVINIMPLKYRILSKEYVQFHSNFVHFDGFSPDFELEFKISNYTSKIFVTFALV
jgi:hypothetical protein